MASNPTGNVTLTDEELHEFLKWKTAKLSSQERGGADGGENTVGAEAPPNNQQQPNHHQPRQSLRLELPSQQQHDQQPAQPAAGAGGGSSFSNEGSPMMPIDANPKANNQLEELARQYAYSASPSPRGVPSQKSHQQEVASAPSNAGNNNFLENHNQLLMPSHANAQKGGAEQQQQGGAGAGAFQPPLLQDPSQMYQAQQVLQLHREGSLGGGATVPAAGGEMVVESDAIVLEEDGRSSLPRAASHGNNRGPSNGSVGGGQRKIVAAPAQNPVEATWGNPSQYHHHHASSASPSPPPHHLDILAADPNDITAPMPMQQQHNNEIYVGGGGGQMMMKPNDAFRRDGRSSSYGAHSNGPRVSVSVKGFVDPSLAEGGGGSGTHKHPGDLDGDGAHGGGVHHNGMCCTLCCFFVVGFIGLILIIFGGVELSNYNRKHDDTKEFAPWSRATNCTLVTSKKRTLCDGVLVLGSTAGKENCCENLMLQMKVGEWNMDTYTVYSNFYSNKCGDPREGNWTIGNMYDCYVQPHPSTNREVLLHEAQDTPDSQDETDALIKLIVGGVMLGLVMLMLLGMAFASMSHKKESQL